MTKWEHVLELSASLESTRKQQGVEAACRGNIACACMSLDSPTKAIEHLGFALALSVVQGDKAGEALHSGNAGLAYRQLHQLSFAEAKVRGWLCSTLHCLTIHDFQQLLDASRSLRLSHASSDIP